MKITLGPLQYYWPRQTVFDFYEAMAATAVDIVYLGEVTCSRRHELRLSDWLDVAELMRASGKTAVLSTQVLLESGSDVSAMQKVAANTDFMVEANDMGAVGALAGQRGFVAGPHLNIYNGPTLQWMASMGASRWVATQALTDTAWQMTTRAALPLAAARLANLLTQHWKVASCCCMSRTLMCRFSNCLGTRTHRNARRCHANCPTCASRAACWWTPSLRSRCSIPKISF